MGSRWATAWSTSQSRTRQRRRPSGSWTSWARGRYGPASGSRTDPTRRARRGVRRRTGSAGRGSERERTASNLPQILPPPGGPADGGRRARSAGPGSRHRSSRFGPRGRTAGGFGEAVLQPYGREGVVAGGVTPRERPARPVRPGVRSRGRHRGALTRAERPTRDVGSGRERPPCQPSSGGREARRTGGQRSERRGGPRLHERFENRWGREAAGTTLDPWGNRDGPRRRGCCGVPPDGR